MEMKMMPNLLQVKVNQQYGYMLEFISVYAGYQFFVLNEITEAKIQL